jgi:nicotinamide mononucleotide transporter
MTSSLEIAANVTMTISILLAGRNSLHTWWTGIVGCILFLLLFYRHQLYADAALQLFFIGTSLVGWWQWQGGQQRPPLEVSSAPLANFAWMIVAGLAASVLYGSMLHAYTDAYAPFADSAVLSLSVIAQLLLMMRRVETWFFWLLVNSIAVPLFASRGLHVTALLYGVYWINAAFSFWWWSRLLRGRQAEGQASGVLP